MNSAAAEFGEEEDLTLPTNLFTEPADFRPAEKPATTATHTLTTAPFEKLTLRLVGHNPLWGHMLWNAGRVVSTYLETHAEVLVSGKRVLELGAGAGLPSLVCALRGAVEVIVTDYPDPDLISNLEHNVSTLPSSSSSIQAPAISAKGYLWGRDPSDLGSPFDTLILSDLLFNHSEHQALVNSVMSCLKKALDARALVFFTPHRPWLYEKDLAFFDTAKEAGFTVEKVLEEVLVGPMFEEDPGDRELRRTVFGFEMRWKEVL
ncbi:hypothetical protein L873DRAFT_1857454 [Choiromyces venosus 120613-1]|uniref:Protein N-terminal and lysine N-methyltransferase EFM7 n=1 Tax=Choiromyces venosus 120613-1 TaxID=1336337 RepID=A0A3N4J8Q9_9PEZI|nr:hypothetical protein L873DRAFT_1857454 [Choiromyces venosus 120613-1]